ncbi:MAG: rubrerythrin [Clostridiales bacterium]|nr:rubrerythrin [Clostridiales bacterium]
MEEKNQITRTTRDRILRAWDNSMELVRDFEFYARETEDDQEAARVFEIFAEEEAMHAARFHSLLKKYEKH